MVTAVVFITVLLVNLYVQSWELRMVSVLFLVVWVLFLVLQIYYLSRLRKGMPRSMDAQIWPNGLAEEAIQ